MIGVISGRGQGLLTINHFMQLFIITCKQTADIVVANNHHLARTTMANAQM